MLASVRRVRPPRIDDAEPKYEGILFRPSPGSGQKNRLKRDVLSASVRSVGLRNHEDILEASSRQIVYHDNKRVWYSRFYLR